MHPRLEREAPTAVQVAAADDPQVVAPGVLGHPVIGSVGVMRSFRFSSNIFGPKSRDEFVAMCRRAEDYGYDTIFAADHLGHAAPFQAVVAAAAAAERLRVGTLVVNVPFWNPALLAREIATADILTGGRLEVGLGSGHMKWEFDEAGIPWESHGARADKLAAAIGELSRLFADDGYQQQAELRQRLGFPPLLPVQRHGFGSGRPSGAVPRHHDRRGNPGNPVPLHRDDRGDRSADHPRSVTVCRRIPAVRP
jgi:alkanesulfonate monooxygenase SsuD/methylene tetrahydromethanopterin reductase-like flavin-dependent oxidoreductase (luciferase family)